MATKMLPGRPYPLGANWNGSEVNFAIFSEGAEKVELCLFDAEGQKKPSAWNYPSERPTSGMDTYVACNRGRLYGYRVHGAVPPEEGLRFNPNKMVIDPYAKALDRTSGLGKRPCSLINSATRMQISSLDDNGRCALGYKSA